MTGMPECGAETVGAACGELGFFPPQQALETLARYLALLEKWNRVMNLVGPASWQEILRTLAADSFYLAAFLDEHCAVSAPECWDLGAGAGLPGIPLRALWQRGSYALVESREKRAGFLHTVLAQCPLPGVFVHHGRAEEFMKQRPPADLIVSRAFLPWKKVLALAGPHLAPDGIMIFLTLAPVPDSLPDGWTASGGKEYTVAGQTRYFWAFTQK